MRELSVIELNEISAGEMVTAVATGALVTLIGWAGIVYYKDVTYQLYKVENIGLVGTLGALVGGLSYIGGTLI